MVEGSGVVGLFERAAWAADERRERCMAAIKAGWYASDARGFRGPSQVWSGGASCHKTRPKTSKSDADVGEKSKANEPDNWLWKWAKKKKCLKIRSDSVCSAARVGLDQRGPSDSDRVVAGAVDRHGQDSERSSPVSLSSGAKPGTHAHVFITSETGVAMLGEADSVSLESAKRGARRQKRCAGPRSVVGYVASE